MDKEWREASRGYMTERIATMDEDRISGTARNAGGKIEEGVGRLTGDARTQIQGKLDQAAGAAQDLYGQTADAARDTAVASQDHRNPALYGGDSGAGDRLAARQNAPAALIGCQSKARNLWVRAAP